jgi:tetratricopeptide (TPR) repeat protein
MEAWYLLGEFLFHFGGRQGRSIAEASEAFQRALRLDPGHYQTLVHLSWVQSIEGRYADVEVLLERLVEVERESEIPLFSRPILAFLREGRPAVSALLPELRKQSAFNLSFGSFRLALLLDGLPAAVEVAGLLTDPSRSAAQHASGYRRQANLELAQGRLHAADEILARWEAVGTATRFETPLEVRAAMWAGSFLPVQPGELERLREELAGLDYDTVFAPLTRPYLLGLVSVRLGRHAEALRYARELENHAAPRGGAGASREEGMARYFASAVLAQVAFEEGDPQEALRLLEEALPEESWATRPSSLLLSEGHERYLRARALEALDRHEEALNWYASLGWTHAEQLFVAPALLRSAEIYERLGEADNAAAHYGRFIARWRDCDAELRPSVDRAQEALVRLSNPG